MTSTQQTREDYAREATVERLWSHTVGIANRALASRGVDPSSGLPGHENEAPGTGAAGKWRDNYFVLTAKHVLENATPQDLSFFARPTGAFKHASKVEIEDALAAAPLHDETAEIYRCDWEDLALITIRPDVLGRHLEFADIRNSWLDPTEGETVVGLGFPVSSASIFQRQAGQCLEKAILLCPIGFSGEVLPPTTGRWFADYDADRHYLIPYNLAAQGKHPRGISGAAVWVPSCEAQVVWAARLNFAGICTSCYRGGTIEQVVKASIVRDFLMEVFGAGE